ncbi:MAG TPA: flagellar export chaperone FliS [Feifaniaceae bacterium]|nr:flagellar export chaperone FliS [Feifaniaceae bacterium]
MYAMNTAFQMYKQQGVLTANPAELIVLLYDGCIKQIKIACLAIEEKNFEQANVSLQKAQRILMELINSLDLSYSIGNDLFTLYEFMLNELAQGNANKDVNAISDIARLLSELRESWAALSKSGVGSVAQMGE